MVNVHSRMTKETRPASLLLVFLVQGVLSKLQNTQYTTCNKLSNFSCRCGDHGVVDLSAVGLQNGEPSGFLAVFAAVVCVEVVN
ncbi:hypothetical protein CHS0354_020503 [Potamilus streckersoni]|uniref:Uncharacterized protein n=1 Tax=Potamilus streckersoni TaxID=2493646 RepID=A0AAE0SZ44_9BIVA|nr:hypothetical protein CHS0354_020503 [Potamilus streckersoni]